jgi:hypothetical protein
MQPDGSLPAPTASAPGHVGSPRLPCGCTAGPTGPPTRPPSTIGSLLAAHYFKTHTHSRPTMKPTPFAFRE